jgi:hypothetical protein
MSFSLWLETSRMLIKEALFGRGGSTDYCFISNHVNSGLVWVDGLLPQSYELTRGTTELVQHFRFKGGVHIGARALLEINLKWFGYIAVPLGRRGLLLVQMITVLPAFPPLREGEVSTMGLLLSYLLLLEK